MLKNLKVSLDAAFGSRLVVRPYSNDMLLIQLDEIELVITDSGELFGVSGGGLAGLEVDIDSRAC